MDDEFDDILLDDYNIDTLDRTQPNTSSLNDDNDESQATATSKKTSKTKFTADLLLEPKGIHLLKNESQYLKFKKTRGHEHEDLKKLMTYYTIWANNLYPGLLFQDFARRVVNPAKSKTVRSVMEQWSDEYRQRRQVRLDVRNELSGRTVGDEDGSGGNAPSGAAQDDESSEDDNRPLFFPISSTSVANTQQKKTAKLKGKPKAKPVAKPRAKTFIDTDDKDEDEDDQPLFESSQQHSNSNKRKIVLDDSSDEEDTHTMSRSSALALIIERKRKREQAQREEQERAAQSKPSTSRSIIEDYDDEDEDEPALFDRQDKDNNDDQVKLAMSDNELAALGIPTQKLSSAQEDPIVEDIELALTEAELMELGLPVNKPDDAKAADDDIQLAFSDNELEMLDLTTSTTTTTTTTTKAAANNTQPPQLEEEQFSDNELFDI